MATPSHGTFGEFSKRVGLPVRFVKAVVCMFENYSLYTSRSIDILAHSFVKFLDQNTRYPAIWPQT